MKKYYNVTLERGGIQSEIYWTHIVSVIQGLSYGLCSIPDGTTCYDTEMFDDVALLYIECGANKFYTFKEHVEKAFPMIKMTYEESEKFR